MGRRSLVFDGSRACLCLLLVSPLTACDVSRSGGLYVPPSNVDSTFYDPSGHEVTADAKVTWSNAPLGPVAAQPDAPVAILLAMVVKRFPPVYPLSLMYAGEIGSVDVDCGVDVAGKLQGCTVKHLSGDPAFARAALTSIQQDVLRPAMMNGQPVAQANLPFHIAFGLEEKGSSRGKDNSPSLVEADGIVVVTVCAVDKQGVASACAIPRPGDPALDSKALAFAEAVHYPAVMLDGVPIDQPHAKMALIYRRQQ